MSIVSYASKRLRTKTQVARQLLNYKKGRFVNTQVSILLNPSDLDERLGEGMAMLLIALKAH